MKFKLILILALAAAFSATAQRSARVRKAAEPAVVQADKLRALAPGAIEIDGYLGQKLDLCIENRLLAQDIEEFTKPFRVRDEPWWGWRGEFWGKWYTSAMLGYGYRPTPEYRAFIDEAAGEIIASQTGDGYIGTSQAPVRVDGNWDIWGRKYALLGLIANYDMTGNRAALDAAVKAADALIEEVGAASGKNISATGWIGWKGLGSDSVLEPIALLYQRTGEKRFLDFAEHIVATWDTPNELSPKGLRLIQGVIEGEPMWKLGGAPKAYEMTSCFEGLCELYRATGNDYYLKACESLFNNVMREEITIIGSGSMSEIWCHTRMRETEVMYEAMETCATATWMKFLYQLLRITGDSKYADAMETGLYNALLAAMTPKGDWWSYFTPLMGERTPSFVQFQDMHSSCCVVNGPRALMLTPYWSVMTDGKGMAVNLYAPFDASVKTPSGQQASVKVVTEYPRDGRIVLTVDQPKAERYMLKLRIPAWSRRNNLKINGAEYDGYVLPGTYAEIDREWNAGDRVELTLDMRTRVAYAPSGSGDEALTRGPVVLAFDSRLYKPDADPDKKNGPMYRYEFLHSAEGDYVDAELVESSDPDIWMTFRVPMKDEAGGEHSLYMCDFTSAGNRWGEGNLFRTWIQQPFDSRHLYPKTDWRINGPHPETCPVIPEKYRK